MRYICIWSRGRRGAVVHNRRWSVRFPLEMNYYLYFINIYVRVIMYVLLLCGMCLRSGNKTKRGLEFCHSARLEILAASEDWSVLTLGSFSLPCYMRYRSRRGAEKLRERLPFTVNFKDYILSCAQRRV